MENLIVKLTLINTILRIYIMIYVLPGLCICINAGTVLMMGDYSKKHKRYKKIEFLGEGQVSLPHPVQCCAACA